ncbi:MAG: hypothetical protein R2932_00915 [Caldilineaceae bacterium]
MLTRRHEAQEWYWGRALLMDARLHNGRDFTTGNIEEINAGISRTVNRYHVQGFGVCELATQTGCGVAGTLNRAGLPDALLGSILRKGVPLHR